MFSGLCTDSGYDFKNRPCNTYDYRVYLFSGNKEQCGNIRQITHAGRFLQ